MRCRSGGLVYGGRGVLGFRGRIFARSNCSWVSQCFLPLFVGRAGHVLDGVDSLKGVILNSRVTEDLRPRCMMEDRRAGALAFAVCS